MGRGNTKTFRLRAVFRGCPVCCSRGGDAMCRGRAQRSAIQKNVEKMDAADEVQHGDAVRYAVQYVDGRNAKRPLHCDLFLFILLL